VWRTVDGFGNEALSGHIDDPHEHFRFGITGAARVSGDPHTMAGVDPPRAFLYSTELTRPQGGIADFYNAIERLAPCGTLDRIRYFSHAVHTSLGYERGVTTNTTTAPEAFNGGAGVCQDYAHVLLALLRLDKTPCRYVAGLASDYGETHAWVEAWVDESWYGTDPTRDKSIDEGYIAISRGRDFADCSIDRGIYKGACSGRQTISLSMEIL
jgi:transglutaminase-like putative cysteine protease